VKKVKLDRITRVPGKIKQKSIAQISNCCSEKSFDKRHNTPIESCFWIIAITSPLQKTKGD